MRDWRLDFSSPDGRDNRVFLPNYLLAYYSTYFDPAPSQTDTIHFVFSGWSRHGTSSSSGQTVSVVIPAMKRITFTSSYSECKSSTILLAFSFTTTVQFKVHLTLTLRTTQSLIICALSLRNLVLGYECGSIFPAGVGPGSPSRDAANWLPSRLSLLIETPRRYGWLRMMVFPGARLL